ncbi:MAG: RDD family protein [Clostridia bacterium]|nr:RDD family protein [Clostridia bacterium]
MNDYEAMYPPKAYKRLIAIVVDIIVCFSFFTFFQLICMPLINNTFHYNDLVLTHQENLVKYNLGRYDVNESGEKFFVEYTVDKGENTITKQEYESAKQLFEQDTSATENAQKMNTVSLVSMSFLLLLAIVPNYLLFPLIHKNGQTLGKWLMHIAIVDKNGFEMTYSRLLFRTLVGLYLCEILISYLLYTMTGIPLVLCVSGVIALIGESKNSIADYISGTSQIDKDISIIE